MSVDTFDVTDWEGPAGPAGAVFDLLQRAYTARTNEKDLGVIAREILALEGDERVRAREAFALLAGMESESPEFHELGRCGLRALRIGEVDYFHEPGFYPEHALKIRLFNVRSALKRPTKGTIMTTATLDSARAVNEAGRQLTQLINVHPRAYVSVELVDVLGGTTKLILDDGVVHKITSDRPMSDPDRSWSEAEYQALRITSNTAVAVSVSGKCHTWRFTFGEDELRLAGDWDSPEVVFAQELFVAVTKVAVQA